MLSLAICSLAGLQLLSAADAQTTLSAKAWQSKDTYPTTADFPESYDPNLSSRPNAAIAFTGGGSRSYLASLGYLGGLHELGLIPKVRYMAGISGGSWATLAYSYSQLNVSDDTLLGAVVDPSAITRDGLNEMDPSCLRSHANSDFVSIALKAVKDDKVSGLADGWAYATQEAYFSPIGIAAGKPFAWSAASVQDIKFRNPALSEVEFVLPTNSERPFPMVGTGLVGPTEGGGYDYDHRNFTMIEITPMYVGQMRKLAVDYQYSTDILNRTHTLTVGGIVENFAFGRFGDSPARGLGSATSGVLEVPMPTSFLDIQFSGAASSYAPGAFVETFTKMDMASKLGLHIDYWSPADKKPTHKDTLFSDGGSYENIMLPSMLQRRVKKIVLFMNEHESLKPASDWNVALDEPSNQQVSDSISSMFGIIPEDSHDATWEQRSFDIRKNQFFAESEWVEFATALQAAQAKGDGIIHTATLTTVKNDWWGVPAGITSEITFVLLGRAQNWEAKLSSEMYQLLVPSDPAEAANMGIDVSEGPFKGFPHFPTSAGLINAEKANALSDLTGWVIKNNAELFKSIFN